MNLIKLVYNLTAEVQFSEAPNTNGKSFIAIKNEIENFCFTVRVLTANEHVSFITRFNELILFAEFFWATVRYHKPNRKLNN